MAKFKVGDRVEIVGSGLASKGWVGTVKSVGDGGGWNIKVQFPAGKYSNDYGEYKEDELYKVLNSASRSSNPVVANALAARNGAARNAEIRVGDKIVATKGIYKGVTATVKDLFVDEKGKAQIRIVEDKYGQSPYWDFGDFKKA